MAENSLYATESLKLTVEINSHFKIISIYLLCVFACIHMLANNTHVSGQLKGICLLLPCGFQGSNLGCQAWYLYQLS